MLLLRNPKVIEMNELDLKLTKSGRGMVKSETAETVGQ